MRDMNKEKLIGTIRAKSTVDEREAIFYAFQPYERVDSFEGEFEIELAKELRTGDGQAVNYDEKDGVCEIVSTGEKFTVI